MKGENLNKLLLLFKKLNYEFDEERSANNRLIFIHKDRPQTAPLFYYSLDENEIRYISTDIADFSISWELLDIFKEMLSLREAVNNEVNNKVLQMELEHNCKIREINEELVGVTFNEGRHKGHRIEYNKKTKRIYIETDGITMSILALVSFLKENYK